MSLTRLTAKIAMEKRVVPRKNRFRVGKTYLILAALRVILTLIPQTGYIHPDEYFQSMEIMIGDIFGTERSPIPDFDSSSPYRNIVVPYLFYGPPLALCKWLFTYFDYRGTIPPYFLLIPCRLLMCLLSFLVDYSLIGICRKYETDLEPRLTLLASSYVMLIFGSRTFSNMIETALFSLLLKIVVTEVMDAEKAYPREKKLKASLDVVVEPRLRILLQRQLKELAHPDFSGSSAIAAICIVGLFCRPTFAAFAVIPVWYWLYRGWSINYLSIYSLHLRWACLVVYGLPIAVIMILLDTMYYKGVEAIDLIMTYGMKECLHRFTKCFVITPLNFVLFNVNEENQIPHGVHPRWLNIVNLILLYNILGYCFLYLSASVIRGIIRLRSMIKFDSVSGLMFSSVALPIIILSVVPHQEPRYIIPITLPLVFVCGPMIYGDSTNGKRRSIGKILFCAWFIINLFFVYFFGFLHQGGLFSTLKYLTSVKNDLQQNNTRMHVLSSHIYTLPLSFFTNSVNSDKNKSKHNKQTKVIMYPTTSTNFDTRVTELETLVNNVKKDFVHDDLIYFIFPASLTRNFTNAIRSKKLKCRFAVEFYVASHISTEAMPKFDWNFDFINEVGLNVVRLKPIKRGENNEQEVGYFDAASEPSVEEIYTNSIRVWF